jgi:hypothetical protein
MNRCFAVLVLCLFALSPLRAEVPPLSKERLEEEAAFIVTGKVTEIKASEPKENNAGTTITYEITLEVTKVNKGKLEDVKTIVVRGNSNQLKKGLVGSSGHRDNGGKGNLGVLTKGSEIQVHLKEPKEKVYDILFPNGFEILSLSKK